MRGLHIAEEYNGSFEQVHRRREEQPMSEKAPSPEGKVTPTPYNRRTVVDSQPSIHIEPEANVKVPLLDGTRMSRLASGDGKKEKKRKSKSKKKDKESSQKGHKTEMAVRERMTNQQASANELSGFSGLG